MNDLDIYYFSGTGNSLIVARDIAQRIHAGLISIPSIISRQQIPIEKDAIGIVFPVYYETYGGIPLIISKFIGKLNNIENKYIFAICTYGSGSIVTLNNIDNALISVGGKLAAGITVNMPENVAGSRYNYPKLQQRMFQTWKESINNVYEFLNSRQSGRFDTPNKLVGRLWELSKIVGTPALRLAKNKTLKSLQEGSSSSQTSYEKLIPIMDNSFSTNNYCNGCGICSKICPAKNIQILNGKPVWQHHCEFCLACFHWCPQTAINSTVFPSTVRYHHPEATLADMMRK
jgi:ferredoxin/flavodoxin